MSKKPFLSHFFVEESFLEGHKSLKKSRQVKNFSCLLCKLWKNEEKSGLSMFIYVYMNKGYKNSVSGLVYMGENNSDMGFCMNINRSLLLE